MVNNIESQLKNRIMRRVYFLYYCRKAAGAFALKIYFAIMLLLGLTFNVSVIDVFNNAMKASGNGMGSISSFSTYAFMHTELIVQALFVLAILFGGFVVVSTTRGFWVGSRA